jgi:hypothetical protein
MDKHPHLKTLHSLFLSENQAFRKVHRMIDLFESIIKTHTVVILSEYIKHNKLSDSAKGLLAQGLRTPSLGTWQLFSRVLFEELQKENYEWFLSDFANAFLFLDKALNSDKTNVIALRNGYAHGATPSDEQCEKDIIKFDSFLTQLLELNWLLKSSLQVHNGQVIITNEKGALSLHPILLYRNEDYDASFAFFNDLKNDKVGLLNYALGKHYKEKEFFTEFHQYLPLHDWKKIGNNEFYQRIEELTETFKGRTIERQKLLQFVITKNKGYFSIQGNPGIGKSALIAQFFKDLRTHEELKKLQVIEYFIRRGTQQAQVEYMFNYLIRRTDDFFAAGKEIRAEGKMIFDLQNQLFAKWRLWGEQSNGQKIIFLIDGLDEGVENNILTYLPRENFDNILIIYGSRPGGHNSIDALWATLPAEHHTTLELGGLGKEDIRALIYEVANKYDVERESAWIDAVQRRSQGNPLYLKLLCDAIEHGTIALNEIDALPEKIDEYYKAILQRYSQDMVDGDALLTSLFTFAAAKDYLTMAHLGLINKLGSASVQRIGSTLKEVLYENPLTDEVLDYQLFHESFREYLLKEKAKEVSDAADRIIDFCATWQELEGNWEQRYALEHYAAHLYDSKKAIHHELLMDLIFNTEYARKQIKTLINFNSSNRFFQLSLLKASELKKQDHVLEAALCLVDLKYEEANDAPQVVALVTTGKSSDLELALKRIENFGGDDEDGLRRKFMLYMLCLMELTLGGSKDKPFRKIAIEKVLMHLDEHLPVDHSILNWSDFFSSYTLFLMAFEWAQMELGYLPVFKRTNNWENLLIYEIVLFSKVQPKILIAFARDMSNNYSKSRSLTAVSAELAKQGKMDDATSSLQEALACARYIVDETEKSRALKSISAELAKQGKMDDATSSLQEALACVRKISNDYSKIGALKEISTELANQGKIEEATAAMQEALTCARDLRDEYYKSKELKEISTELANQGKIEEATAAMQEALVCAIDISDNSKKYRALSDISTELAIQGKMQEALACARDINDEPEKSRALKEISAELAKQGKTEDAASSIQEALACAREISSRFDKNDTLKVISTELAKQGKREEALACAREISIRAVVEETISSISVELIKQGKLEVALACAYDISDVLEKSRALKEISAVLATQGKLEEATPVLYEALACAIDISDDFLRDIILPVISTEWAKQGKIEEALACARDISAESEKITALREISTEWAKQGNTEEATYGMQETLSSAPGKSIRAVVEKAITAISVELTKQGKLEEALACTHDISDEYFKTAALRAISAELAKQGKIEESLASTRDISNKSVKSEALSDISAELAKQGKIEESLACARDISNESKKIRVMSEISTELAKQGKIEAVAFTMQEALTCARDLSDDDYYKAVTAISTELAKQGKIEEAASKMQEALTFARDLRDESKKSIMLSEISAELIKQGKFKEALACAHDIIDKSEKCRVLSEISAELTKQGKFKEATSSLQEALTCAREIKDKLEVTIALKTISTELAKQGKMAEALACAREISFRAVNYETITAISTELAKLGKMDEALSCARDISDETEKSRALKAISTELAKQGYWALAEITSLEIPQIAHKQSCWIELGTNTSKEKGWQKALQQVVQLKNEEAQLFYLKGWVEVLNQKEVDEYCMQEALTQVAYDTESIEKILQKYSQYEVCFNGATKEKISRLNRSLNIQWLVDIAAKFPNPPDNTYLSTNLDTWMHEIADEDDRDDVKNWVQNVQEGKMSEEKFSEKVKSVKS